MKKVIYNPNPLQLTTGYFYEKEWNNFAEVNEGLLNWQYNCMYQLQQNAMSGKRWILHLNTMQTNHVIRKAGLMHSPTAAKDCFNILIIKKCADKASFGDIKLKTGKILFFDDKEKYLFINNDEIEIIVITIKKSELESSLPSYNKLLNHFIFDTDSTLSSVCSEIYKQFTDTKIKHTFQDFADAEEKIFSVCKKLLSKQVPKTARLTKGEKIALEIRENVFKHMDGNISISSLAKDYSVSEQTLQNSFKSLFGYTPNKFLRLLKLNLVYQELSSCNSKQTSVSKVAYKWGFTQMGQFGAYYKELFNENPSDTLRAVSCIEENIKEGCTLRQEEME